ncbi:MAG: hypothetical protein GC155_13665 [Alphaproteobacteria bacterium]|nr:hypothetical protein [Alphaproteobacteria bacterium]
MSGEGASGGPASVLKGVMSVVTLVLGVAGASLGYFEYKAHQQEVRIDRVFGYSDAFHGPAGSYAEAEATLANFSETYWTFLDQNPADKADQYVVDTVRSDPELRKAMNALTTFFDTLSICVSEDLCDERTTRALFANDLEEFRNLAYPWLVDQTTHYGAKAGAPLLCLRKQFKTTPMPARDAIWNFGRPRGPCATAAG